MGIQLKQLFIQSWAGLFSVTKYFHCSPHDDMTCDSLWCPLKNALMYATFFHSVVRFGFKIPVLGICQTC